MQHAVIVIPTLPLVAKEMVVSRMDGAEAKGTCNINLRHQGMSPEMHDRVHGIIDSGVPERKIRHADAVIDAISRREREVHDQAQCACLLLGYGTKGVDYECREERFQEGTQRMTCSTLF